MHDPDREGGRDQQAADDASQTRARSTTSAKNSVATGSAHAAVDSGHAPSKWSAADQRSMGRAV